MRFILFALFISAIFASEFYQGYEYHFTSNDTEAILDPNDNHFFVIGFSGNNCADCYWQQYILALNVYTFEIYDDVVIGATETESMTQLSEFCDVDIDSARVELRIVYPHATHCVEYDYDSNQKVDEWISSVIGRKSRISFVHEISNSEALDRFMNDKEKSYFIDFFVPGNEACYSFSLDVERIAESYGLEPSIKFIRIDCSNNIDLCEERYNITHFPSYRFVTPDIYHSNNVTLGKATTYAFIDFIDAKINLHRILGGGLDTVYGREPLIDSQIDTFIQGDETTRKSILRDIYIHRKTYTNSATYYKYMKNYMKTGQTYIQEQLNQTQKELDHTYIDDNNYGIIKSRLNILYRFEEINPNKTILLNAYNYDRVLCHDRDFFVLFYDIQCDECREFSAVYREVFKRRGWRNGFAAINAASNGHIRDRLGINTHPEIRWYPKHCDLYNPEVIDIEEKTVDNIVKWLDDKYNNANEDKNKKSTEDIPTVDTENQNEDNYEVKEEEL